MRVWTVAAGIGLILFGLITGCALADGEHEDSNLPEASSAEPPFYTDKFDLMVYLDEGGERHPVRNADAWAKRRAHILANMELVMGPLPDKRKKVPLDIVEVSVEKLPGLTRKKITYVSEAGHRVPAYLVVPNDLKGPAPAMLCLHGSGGYDGRTAGLGKPYPRYALELAQRGYVAIAPDYPMFGGNQVDPREFGYVSGTMKGVWDHMRAVDVLQSLPEVDDDRIGCIGNSLGGHNALFVAVFDSRLKAIVCSSGFDSFVDYLNGNLSGWCQPCYMPRIDSVYGKNPKALPFDFPGVLAALAPRPLFINAPLRDGNFKAASVDKCVKAALPVYKLLGAESNVKAIHPDARHGFSPDSREQAYQFLDKALKKASPAERLANKKSIATTHMLEGKFPEARAEWVKIMDMEGLSDADKADVQLQIALSYYEAGDYARADPELEKVLTMPGANKTQERSGGWLNYVPSHEAKLRLVKMCPADEKENTIVALFIGSSMTLRGHMPLLVERLSAAAPAGRPRIMSVMYTRGGTGIEVFWEEGDARDTARGKMASVPWDVVVLETSPRRPVASNLKYGKLFCDLARNRSIKPVLYENHVTREASYPDAHQKYHDDEVALGKALQSPLAPLQLAEMYYLDAVPSAERTMFYADSVHPSEKGYYLAAYCIYSVITGYSPVGLDHPNSMSDEEAKALQEAAWKAVQESNPDLKPLN